MREACFFNCQEQDASLAMNCTHHLDLPSVLWTAVTSHTSSSLSPVALGITVSKPKNTYLPPSHCLRTCVVNGCDQPHILLRSPCGLGHDRERSQKQAAHPLTAYHRPIPPTPHLCCEQ